MAQCIGYAAKPLYVLRTAVSFYRVDCALTTLYLTITLSESIGFLNFYYMPGISQSVGDLIILSTRNERLLGINEKFLTQHIWGPSCTSASKAGAWTITTHCVCCSKISGPFTPKTNPNYYSQHLVWAWPD